MRVAQLALLACAALARSAGARAEFEASLDLRLVDSRRPR